MKYLFISLFFLLSSTVFGKYDPKPLLEYMKNDPIPLSYDVKEQKYNISDFSTYKLFDTGTSQSISLNAEAIVPFAPINDAWYLQDFAEDPFDGRMEVVIGEPLPSVPLTLFIASIMLFTLMKYRKLNNKPETQEIF